ncbi:MAG: DUF547 domain-containing protein [Rhodobacteraceae bacterium]|nr:DUF547 domain-containing protein [Paracoccaceae bacterium]
MSISRWGRVDLEMNGVLLSLNDVEHGIIRPVFQGPRIHFALNCASTGCSNLAAKAWKAQDLSEALDQAERAYVNDPRIATLKPDGGVEISKIYIWFQDDSGSGEADVLTRPIQKADPNLSAALEAQGRIDSYAYDWSLNDQRRWQGPISPCLSTAPTSVRPSASGYRCQNRLHRSERSP